MKKAYIAVPVIAVLIIAVFAVLSAAGGRGGRSAAGDDTATKELRQNDYRGGIMRTQAVGRLVLSSVEDMKSGNAEIRTESPNTYWDSEGWQDFVMNFMSTPLITDTSLFNEEETDWQTVTSRIFEVENSFTKTDGSGSLVSRYPSMTITRNEKDDYTILSGQTEKWAADGVTLSGSGEWTILYDCDKDWCKALLTVDTGDGRLPGVTLRLFEYRRLDEDHYAIQTETERLLVVLAPAEADTDIRERTVSEFYYSRLSGNARSTFKAYELLPETGEWGTYSEDAAEKNALYASYPFLNENGDFFSRYGKSDSVFLINPDESGRASEALIGKIKDWVFEDASLRQAFAYRDGVLCVTTYNKLSERYERFTFYREGASEGDIRAVEDIVRTDGLNFDGTVLPSGSGGNAGPEPVPGGQTEEPPAVTEVPAVTESPAVTEAPAVTKAPAGMPPEG